MLMNYRAMREHEEPESEFIERVLEKADTFNNILSIQFLQDRNTIINQAIVIYKI
jgi:hypothetical protein